MQFRPQRTWDGAGRALEEQKADCASQPGWLFSPDREVSPLLTVVFLLPAPAPPPQDSQQMLGRLIPEKQILSDQLKQVQQNSLHSRCLFLNLPVLLFTDRNFLT